MLFVFFLSICFFSCDRKKNIDDSGHKMAAYIDTANKMVNSSKAKESIFYIDSVYNIQSSLSVLDLFEKYHFKKSYYIYYNRDFKKAALNVDSLSNMLEDKKDKFKPQYAISIFDKGDLLFAEGKLSAAFQSYFKGREFVQNNLDVCNFANFTAKLGLIRYRQGEYLKAIPFFKQSTIEYNSCTDKDDFKSLFVLPQSNLNSIALCYEKSNQLDSAAYYYDKAVSFIDDKAKLFPDRSDYVEIAKGVVLGNLGGIYLKLNKFEQAEKCLTQSIAINSKPGHDIEDAKTAQRKLAQLFLLTNRSAEARVLIDQVVQNSGDNFNQPLNGNRLLVYELNWKYFESIKQLEKAYDYSQHFYALRDSISEHSETLKKTDIDEVFRNAEEDLKLDVFRRNAEIKNLYLLGICVFLLLTLIILLLVWGNLKKSRKYVSQLKELNNKVSEQNIQMQYTLEALEQKDIDNQKIKKIVAHDLRNPIGGMVMGANYLRTTYPDFKEIQMLELIEKSGNSSLVLINDLLKIQSDTDVIKKEKVDFYDILAYSVDLLRLKANNKGQLISLDADSVMIDVSKDKMYRVFNNLMDNAIKFSSCGSTILVKAKSDEDNLVVTVEDFGIGISDEVGANIFDMFSPHTRAGTEGEQTFGMGLSITKRLIEGHGGKIWYENKLNQTGSIFYVQLPLN